MSAPSHFCRDLAVGWPGFHLAALVLCLAACSTRTTNLVSTRNTPDASGRDASTDRDGALPDAQPPISWTDAGLVLCGDHVCACNNGLDDDGDELSDGFDPECTGPFDDNEVTFATGAVGEDHTSKCLDCFFDGNVGPGDDACRYPASCSLDGTAQGAGRACNTCDVSDLCVNNCLPRTPNGCDCFGCCEVLTPQGEVAIRLTDTCSLRDVGDPVKCPRCVQTEDCRNPCGPCELCPGKTQADLPPSCADSSGPGYSCEGGRVCGPTLPCEPREYCEFGCCIPVVF